MTSWNPIPSGGSGGSAPPAVPYVMSTPTPLSTSMATYSNPPGYAPTPASSGIPGAAYMVAPAAHTGKGAKVRLEFGKISAVEDYDLWRMLVDAEIRCTQVDPVKLVTYVAGIDGTLDDAALIAALDADCTALDAAVFVAAVKAMADSTSGSQVLVMIATKAGPTTSGRVAIRVIRDFYRREATAARSAALSQITGLKCRRIDQLGATLAIFIKNERLAMGGTAMDSALVSRFLLDAVKHLPELSAVIAAYEQNGLLDGRDLLRLLQEYEASRRYDKEKLNARALLVKEDADDDDSAQDTNTSSDDTWWMGYQHAMALVVQGKGGKGGGKGGKGRGKGGRGPSCWNCGKIGHLQRNCPDLPATAAVVAAAARGRAATARTTTKTDFRLGGR